VEGSAGDIPGVRVGQRIVETTGQPLNWLIVSDDCPIAQRSGRERAARARAGVRIPR